MAKFKDLAAGTRARKAIVLPLDGAEWDPDADDKRGAWKGGRVEKLDVRVLDPGEWAQVMAGARAFAIENGVEPEHAKEGTSLYEYGVQLHAVALACVDCDSPADKPAPYFEGGVEEIRASARLTPEIIAYLHQQWDAWQGECNPRAKNLSPAQWWSTTLGIADPDEVKAMRFFIGLALGTQWRYARSLAQAHIALLAASSSSGTDASSTPSSTEQPRSEEEDPRH